MTRKLLAVCGATLALWTLAGCGTLVNATGAREPFGGVTLDGCLATYPVATACGLWEREPELPGPPASLLLACLATLDLPLSAVADMAVLCAKSLDANDSDPPKENTRNTQPTPNH